MYWMFTGYLASFYAVLAVDAVRTLPTHPNPQMGWLAYIVLIPGLIAVVSAEAVLLAPDAWKKKIRQGFKSGSLTRLYAFGSGAITSLGVLLCGLFAYFLYEAALSGSIAWLKPHEKTVFNTSLLVLFLLLAFGPILPGAWLATKAERSAKTT
jgi:hypothetical protein